MKFTRDAIIRSRSRLLSVAVLLSAALLLPTASEAATFKFDTMYKLEGDLSPITRDHNFIRAVLGHVPLGEAYLFYDSAAERLTIDITARGGKYEDAQLHLDLQLAAAKPKGTSVEDGQVDLSPDNSLLKFMYLPDAPKDDGKTAWGTLNITGTPKWNGSYDVASEMGPLIATWNGSLYFFSWISAHAEDSHSFKADPFFKLVEMGSPEQPPSGEVPEPMSLVLLLSGLCAGWRRRCVEQCNG